MAGLYLYFCSWPFPQILTACHTILLDILIVDGWMMDGCRRILSLKVNNLKREETRKSLSLVLALLEAEC